MLHEWVYEHGPKIASTGNMVPRNIEVLAAPLERFRGVIDDDSLTGNLALGESFRKRLSGRVLWNVNSTEVGGGVAEMLRPLLRYARGAGVDARWSVIEGSDAFFAVTKRLHNALHGSTGDGSSLGTPEHEVYESVLRENAVQLTATISEGDVVILHDPQTAGLAPHLLRAGALVIWRCHIGSDTQSGEVEKGWRFLAPYLRDVPAFVFSRAEYVPSLLAPGRSHIIQPSIDAFSAKNQELSEETVRTVLVHTGLVEGPPPPGADTTFRREDGSPGRVEQRADVVGSGRAPSWDTPLVVQVSRWDSLKDPIGVMRGFATLVEGRAPRNAELVLAGPNTRTVADDPEGGRVYSQVVSAWRELSHSVRNRIHLASLPTADVEENATIVNALQRHSAVIVQKSLREGFGLTVTEALWKRRPVLASCVGGIKDQIVDGEHGLLLDDPTDLIGFSQRLRRLLEDPELCRRLGEAGRDRVREYFLGPRHLAEYARLIESLET